MAYVLQPLLRIRTMREDRAMGELTAAKLALALTQTARLTLTLAAPLQSSSLSQSSPVSPIRSMPVFSSQFLSALFPLSSQIQPPQEQSSQVQPSQIPPSEVQSSTMQSAQSLQ